MLANQPVSEEHQWFSRTASCQLPALPLTTGRNVHRPSHSCDIDGELLFAGHHGLPRPPKTGGDHRHQGAKPEKQKAGYSAHAAITLLSFFIVMVPVAFVAGYSTALLAKPYRSTSSLHYTSLYRAAKGGGLGRLLSADVPALDDVTSGTEFGGFDDETDRLGAMVTDEPRKEVNIMPQEVPNVLFVTWIAFGDFGDGGFHTHNFHRVDMRWAEVVRKSHPGCKVGLILDQDTQLDRPEDVDFLFRLTIDKTVYGRNEYNDFYHWTARYSFLEKLRAEGEEGLNVVFLDPDVFVLDDIREVFGHSGFDYATTISENPVQPINGAMHFVRAHHYGAAIEILKGVLATFHLQPEMGFTAGQQAYSDFFELTEQEDLVARLQEQAVTQGIGCNQISEGGFSICFVICTRYNFWEDCSDHPAMQVEAGDPKAYEAAHVKVLHFIAYRKLGMQMVYDAFMEGGLTGAYAAWAGLPHNEDDFDADPRFGDEA